MNPDYKAPLHRYPEREVTNGKTLAATAKIRWREHELILVTIICLSGIAGYCWKIFSFSSARLETWYGRPFSDNHLVFNYYINVLLPRIGVFLMVYLCYLRMNLFILPRLLQTGAKEKGAFDLHFSLSGRIAMEGAAGETLKKSLWAMGYTFLLILLLGAGWGIALYYEFPYNYSLPDSQTTILGMGLKRAFSLVIAFAIYASLREAVIRWMDASPGLRSYRVSITNQVSGFLVIYFSFGGLLYSFNMIDDNSGGFFAFYFSLLPSALLVCLSNLYWLFPLNPGRSVFRRLVFRRLLGSTALWSLPFSILFCIFIQGAPPDVMIPVFFSIWLGQLLIVTPLSWFIYRQRKDKILALRGLEKELGRSQADLEFLRSQINPHFLFNVLNTLYGSALQENADQTAGGIQQLGDMMRFMLHENTLDRIPMEREIGYLNNYISLQQMRAQSSPLIHIDAKIDEAFCNHRIAPMLLIPFVENAFKHGISLQEESWIKIRLHCDPKSIHFEVRNSVHIRQGEDPEKDKSGIGMKNVLNRLKLVYPGRHEFYVHQDEREFFVQLSIQP
jgi:two-component system LytT family sensor kinase